MKHSNIKQLFILWILSLEASTTDQYHGELGEVVCPELIIRRASQLALWSNCTVVEGSLYLVASAPPSFYLPPPPALTNLREVTGTLVVVRLAWTWPDSLGRLLPNLTVVRGGDLTPGGYAIVVRETPLKAIDLPSLRLIKNGDVWLDANPVLCHVASLDWKSIFHRSNAELRLTGCRQNCPDVCPSRCPRGVGLSGATRGMCWSVDHCQSLCSSACSQQHKACHMSQLTHCCHAECLAGCYGDGPNQCVACRHVLHKGSCVRECPAGYYVYKRRRCITREQCFTMQTRIDHQTLQPYTLFRGACVAVCPPKHARNATTGHCEFCQPKDCPRKRCNKVIIYTLDDLDSVKGCYSIKVVFISLKVGTEGVMEALDKAFAELREVEHSIRVVRCTALVSLGFLRGLERLGTGRVGRRRRASPPHTNFGGSSSMVNGSFHNLTRDSSITQDDEEIHSHPATLEILDNANMHELWDWRRKSGRLQVLGGPVVFRQNPHLCPSRILDLVDQGMHLEVNMTKTERDLVQQWNGDMAICKVNQINLTVVSVSATRVSLESSNHPHWQTIDITVLIMYKKSNSNVSLYEDRASCGTNTWKTVDIKGCHLTKESCEYTLSGLEAYTRYAVYIETMTWNVKAIATSEIVYFHTRPGKPDPPGGVRVDALNSRELMISWNAPLQPRGVVTKYYAWYRPLELEPADFMVQDYCFHKPVHLTQAPKAHSKTASATLREDDDKAPCDCTMCLHLCERKRRRLVSRETRNSYFEVELHNILFSRKLHFESNKNLTEFVAPKVINVSQVNESVTPQPTVPSAPETPTPSQRTPILWTGHVEVAASKTSVILSNLKHFTEYIIYIQACQDPDEIWYAKYASMLHRMRFEGSSPKVKLYTRTMAEKFVRDLCSKRVVLNQRIGAQESMDNVDLSQIKVSKKSEATVTILWKPPADPNGLILYYLLRYRRVAHDVNQRDDWFTKCISRKHWQTVGMNVERHESHLGSNQEKATNSTVYRYKRDTEGYPPSSDVPLPSDMRPLGGVHLDDLLPGKYELQLMAVSLAGNGSWTPSLSFGVESHPISGRVAYLIGSVTFTALLLITIFVAFWIYREHKKHLLRNTWVSSNPEYWNIYEIDAWEMNREDIDMMAWIHLLGRGSFGLVYRGKLRQLTTPAKKFYDDSTGMQVAVKTLAKTANMYDRRDFINEACHMKQFQSAHLVRILGVVSKTTEATRANLSGASRLVKSVQEQFLRRSVGDVDADRGSDRMANMPMVVMELMSNGDLANYLRHIGDEGEGSVPEEQALLWSAQIADGMAYLGDRKYVHRDLAARNCMVDSKMVVKIGDFGLARDVCYSNYYRKEGRARVPIRWMAPESLKNACFDYQTDVWSYGVVLWEIVTLAAMPYRGMSHEEVIKYVLAHNNLLTNGPPLRSSELILSLMTRCWNLKPARRPTFHQILNELLPYTDSSFREVAYVTGADQDSGTVAFESTYLDLSRPLPDEEMVSLLGPAEGTLPDSDPDKDMFGVTESTEDSNSSSYLHFLRAQHRHPDDSLHQNEPIKETQNDVALVTFPVSGDSLARSGDTENHL